MLVTVTREKLAEYYTEKYIHFLNTDHFLPDFLKPTPSWFSKWDSKLFLRLLKALLMSRYCSQSAGFCVLGGVASAIVAK